jgi:3-oxoacyl-[acyl-carrier protein] reductase
VVTDLGNDRVEAVVQEISAVNGTAQGWELDVTDSEAIKKVFDEIALWGKEDSPRIDVLVNNAGISVSTAIDDPDYEQAWDTSVAVMLTAQTRTIRAALPYLRKSENPRIINISSTEGVEVRQQHQHIPQQNTE